MWFFKENPRGICYVLNNVAEETSFDKIAILNFFEQYFYQTYNIKFSNGYYLTEKFKDESGDIEKINKKIEDKKDIIISFNAFNLIEDTDYYKICVSLNLSKLNNIYIIIKYEIINFDFKDFITQVNKYFKSQYGYVFSGRLDKYFNTFIFGDTESSKYVEGTTKTNRDDLMQWRFNCEKLADGYFRDIFPINIVSNKHIENKIGNKSIKEIIIENKLGQLEHIIDDIFYWNLDDKQLKQAREILYKTDYVI